MSGVPNSMPMNCKNCGYSVEGNYCSHCGQKASVGRITFSSILQEVSESIFQVNKGFSHTLIGLFVRPGDSINEYLEGKRKSHFKPIAYLLILSTVYFLTTQALNQATWVGDIITGWMTGAAELSSDAEIPGLVTWLLSNYAYLTLLLVPVFSLASYLAFYTFRKTYLEHIVINSYITGQQAIFYAFFILGRAVIDHELMELLPVVLAVSYTFYVFWRLFSAGNRMMNVLRSIITYLLYGLFCFVLLGVLMGIKEL
jgi:hypothetical protein